MAIWIYMIRLKAGRGGGVGNGAGGERGFFFSKSKGGMNRSA